MCFQISLQNCNDRYTLFIINLFINRTNRSTDSSLHTGIGWWYWTFKIKVRVKVSEIAIPPFFQSFQPFNNRACSTISYHRSIDSTHKQSITRLQTSGQLVGADANAFRVCSSYILSSWAVTLCRACTTGWAHKSPRIAARTFLTFLTFFDPSLQQRYFIIRIWNLRRLCTRRSKLAKWRQFGRETENFIDFFASPWEKGNAGKFQLSRIAIREGGGGGQGGKEGRKEGAKGEKHGRSCACILRRK